VALDQGGEPLTKADPEAELEGGASQARFGPPGAATLLLAAILVLAVFHTLHAARSLFLPIVLAVLANLALTPIIRTIRGWGLPGPLAAAVVVVALVIAGGGGLAALSTPAANWMDRAPNTLREVERKLRPIRAPVERIARVTREVQEATEIEQEVADPVIVSESSLFADLALETRGFLTTLIATIVLLFFLLASNDGLARALSGFPPWIDDHVRAQHFVEAIEADVSRHLLTVSLVNAGLGIAVALTLGLLGMPNPALWGAMAALLNFVPFLGAVAGTLIVAGVALISFEGLTNPLMVAGAFALLTGVEGLLVTPTVLGRRLTLSPVAVFLSLLVWSFVWGVPGALIAVPVLAVVKIIWDRTAPLSGGRRSSSRTRELDGGSCGGSAAPDGLRAGCS